MADYRIKVGIELDTTNLQRKLNKISHEQKLNITAALNIDVTNYQKLIRTLQENCNNVKVSVKAEEIAELQAKIGEISKQVDVFNNKGINTSRIKDFNIGLGESGQKILKLNEKTGELEVTVTKLTTNYAAINREKEKEIKLTNDITEKQKTLKGVVEKLKLGEFNKHDLDAFDEISKKINNVSLTAKSSIQELSTYQKELGRVVANSKLGEVKKDSGLSFKSSQVELQNYLQTLFKAEKQFVQIKDKLKIVSLSDGEQWKQHTAIIKNSQGQWEKYVVSINSVTDALRIAKEGIVNVNSNLSNTEEILKARLQSKLDTFKNSLNSNLENLKIGGLSEIDSQRVNALQNEISLLSTETKNAEQEMKRLGISYKNVIRDLKSGRLIDTTSSLGLKTNDAELQKYIAGLKQVETEQVKIANSSKIVFGRNGEQIRIVNALVREGSDTWRQYQYSINTASNETRELDKGLKNVTVTKSRTIEQIKNMIALYFSLSTAIRLLKKAMSDMKDADTEIITIQKVSRRSLEEMNSLMQSSYSVATEYGRKSAEYLKAVSEFTKGGYGKTADELGKLSLLTQNVGDITSEQANKFLLAADAAWKLNGDVSELTKILDGFNDVGNKNATNIEKLADGIKVAGSYFANAGLEAKEYAAIIGTATTATQQSGDTMGRAWRTILMNIRQMKGETAEGEIIDDKQLANAEKALRKVGISVREYKNNINELRNPMKVLEELAGKWKTLNSVQQSMLLQNVAGKLHANALIAVMENWDKVIKMQEEYANASGSAMRENEFFTNSWQAKLKSLESAWTQFVAKTVDTSWIKGLLDSGTKLLSVIGSLGNALIFLAGTFLFLRHNNIVSGLSKLKNTFTDLYKTIALVITGNMQLATSEQVKALAVNQAKAATIAGRIALLGYGTALNMALGVIGIAITAFSLIKMGIDSTNVSMEKARQAAMEHADASMKEKQAIDDLVGKYTEISDSVNYDEDARKQLADIQKQLIEQYGIEAGSIDLINGKYDDNIKKINELKKAKLQAIIDENKVLAETSQDDISQKSYGNPFAYKRGQTYYHPMENLFDKSLSVEEYIAALEDMRKRLTEKSGEFEGIVEKDRQNFAVKLNEKMNKAKEELKKNTENINFVKEAMTEFNKISIASAFKFSKEREELFRILSEPVELDIKNESQFTRKLRAIAKEINGIPVEKFTELKQAYANYQKAIATDDNALLSSGMQQIRDLKKELTTYSSDITRFKKALDDLFDISQYDNEVKTLGKSIKELMFDMAGLSQKDPLYEGLNNSLNAMLELKSQASEIFENPDDANLINVDKLQMLVDSYNAANDSGREQIKVIAELGEQLNNIDNSKLQETLDIITKGVTADNILKVSIQEVSDALKELQIDTTMFDGVTDSILNLKTGFDDGKISADEFFRALNEHVSNIDFDKMFGGDSASIQKYFTALSSEVSSGLEKVISQFSSGTTLASDYAKSISATAQSYNSLIDKLKEGNKTWGNNSAELEKNAAVLKEEQTAVDDSVKSLSSLVPALEAIENVSAETAKKGSEEWEKYYHTISDALAGIVAASEVMLVDVNGNILATSNQIYNALVNNTLSFETASETILKQANESITKIGQGIGKFLNILGNEIKNFKFSFSIIPKISFSKEQISPLLPFPAPEVNFDFKVTNSGSIGNIINAFSSLADVVSSNLPKISLDDLITTPKDLLDGKSDTGKGSKGNNAGKGSKGDSKGTKSPSSKSGSEKAKKEYEELLNFADKAIAEVSQRITELRQKLENAVTPDDKNTIIDAIITAEREKIKTLQQAIDLYSSHAQKALGKIPKELQKSVVEGSIDLKVIKDENVKKAIDEYNKWNDSAVKLKNEISGINKEINSLNTEKFENLNKKFESSLKPLQGAITEVDFKLKLLGDKDYESKIKLLNQQFEAQESILSRTSEELKNIKELYQNGQITAEQFKERTDSLNKSWQDGVITANGYTQAIRDVHKAQSQAELSQFQENKSSLNALVEMTKNLIRQQSNAQIKAIQDEINGHNEAKKALQEKAKQLDEQLKKQKKINDAQKKAIDDEIKKVKELADAEKKRLNEKLKAYEETISKAKQALDIEKEQYSYQNDLDTKQREIEKLENQIAELLNDTSRAGIAERQKLEEELAKKRKDLADFIYNNDVDKRKNALDSELQAFKETISNELELNDKKLKLVLDGYDKQKEAINELYEKFSDKINREKELLERQSADYDRMAEKRKKEIDSIQEKINSNAELTRQAMQKIDSDGEKLYDDLIQWNYEYGTGIERDVKDAWDSAKRVLLQYNSTLQATIALTERISDLNREIKQFDSISYGSDYYDGRNTVSVRQKLERAGYTVDWDNNTKSIIVDGKSYSSSGFQNINGTLYGTEDDIIKMLKALGLWRGSFAVGGKIYKDGFAQIHEGEEIITKDYVGKAEPVVAKSIDTLEKFVNISATIGNEIMDKLKNFMNLENSLPTSNIKSGVQTSKPVQNNFKKTDIKIDAPVTIQGNVSENALPNLKKMLDAQKRELVGEITKNLYQGGVRASVRSFSQ